LARKILLADDSVTAQNMGRKILTEAGYEVITVNNGSAALKRITEQKPDVIVLDVYMPGYGGLEVCHRLKENPETARIPVLLTVGKLEPFKAEEARRVRADMHIVKPFDTSELLSAIAKLEDRIVAQAEMPKKGRFAKPGAEDGPPLDSFGDQQSGWKSRLIAPRKKAKAEKSELKTEVREESREEVREQTLEQLKGQEEPSRSYTMDEGAEEHTLNTADWRTLLSTREAEETAAAAKQASPGSTQEIVKEKVEETVEKRVDKTADENAERNREARSDDHESAAVVSYRSAAEIVARAEAAVKAEKEQDSAEPKTGETSDISAKQDHGGRDAGDRDVADALASLVPAPNAADLELENDRRLVPTAVGQSELRGPRWIAQTVLVSQEESSGLLEQEMERAFKQFSATEPSATFVMGPLEAMSFSTPDEEEAPSQAKNATRVEVAVQKTEPRPVDSGQQSEPQAVLILAAGTQMTAQTEPKSTEEAATPVQRPSMGALWMSAPAAYVAATTNAKPLENHETSPANADVPAPEVVAAESAFAAAASAAAPSFAANPETTKPKSENKESELAAAWQSWRQGRDGDVQPGADASPAPEASAVDHEENQGEEISSLVDTMLAELKPKLMKEIAKKMGKDKESKR